MIITITTSPVTVIKGREGASKSYDRKYHNENDDNDGRPLKLM